MSRIGDDLCLYVLLAAMSVFGYDATRSRCNYHCGGGELAILDETEAMVGQVQGGWTGERDNVHQMSKNLERDTHARYVALALQLWAEPLPY